MTRLQWWLFGVLLAGMYLLIALFVLHPKYAWVHPEISVYDKFTLNNDAWAIAKTFNWEPYEFVPRFSRPISNFFQIVEAEVRHAVAHSILPYIPTFSPLIFLVCLFLTPFLTWRVLAALVLPGEIRAAGYLLALVSPVNLSHLGLFFRPAKALSELFFLTTVLIYLRILKKGVPDVRDRVILSLSLLLAFMSDEYGALAYAFVVTWAMRDLWRMRRPLFPWLVAVPVLVLFCYIWFFPKLAYWLWDLQGGTSSYFIFDKILRNEAGVLAGFVDVGENFVSFFVQHFWIFVSETYGLMFFTRPSGWGGALLWLNTLALLSVAGFIGFHFWTKGAKEPGDQSRLKLVIKLLAFFALTVVFHSVLMSLVVGPYGPYYYAGISSLLLLLALSIGLVWVPPNLRLLSIAPLLATNIFVHVHTNQAMKRYHYYPYSYGFIDMFTGWTNRFEEPVVTPLYVRELKNFYQLHGKEKCMALPLEYNWFVATSNVRITRELHRNTPATPELCDGTSCCAGENRPACTVFCGTYDQ